MLVKNIISVMILTVSVGNVAAQDITHGIRALIERVEQLQLSDGALKESRKEIQGNCNIFYAQAKKKKDVLWLQTCASLNALLKRKNKGWDFKRIDDLKSEYLLVGDQLLLADVYAMHSRHEEALSAYDRVGKAHEDVNRAYASEGMSDVYRRCHKLEKSLEWLDASLKVLNYLRGDYKKADFEHGDYLQYVITKRKNVESLLQLMKHGIGFSLYKQAQTYLKSKRYADALSAFDELLDMAEQNRGNDFEQIIAAYKKNPELGEEILKTLPVRPVYAEAATLFRNKALVALGETKMARKNIMNFIKKDKLGLYRGDAHRILAEIAFKIDRKPARAIQYYDHVENWVADVRGLEKNLSEYQVPDVSRDVTAAPQAWKKMDKWGNVVWERPQSQAIVNRLSAPWYLEALLVDCYLQRSMCHFLTGNKRQALSDLERMHALDKEDKRVTKMSGFSNYNRLKSGYELGKLYATKEELRSFPMKALVPLMSAELYFETEQWEQAIVSYAALIKEFEGSLKEDPMAYLHFALASAYLYHGNKRKGESIMRPHFVDEKSPYYKTLSWPRAMFAMSNIDQKKDPWKWLWMGYEGTTNQDYRSAFY